MGSAPCNRGALNVAPPLPEVSGKHANEVSHEALTNHFRGKFFRLLAMTARTLGSSVPAFNFFGTRLSGPRLALTSTKGRNHYCSCDWVRIVALLRCAFLATTINRGLLRLDLTHKIYLRVRSHVSYLVCCDGFMYYSSSRWILELRFTPCEQYLALMGSKLTHKCRSSQRELYALVVGG